VKPAARLLVKICGITREEDAVAAAEAGADAVGFVMWPGSPRAVTPAAARRLGAALPPFVLRVGVFVDAGREALLRAADEAGLDLLQLHGSEPPEACADLPRRALKAVRIGPGFTPEDALRYEGRVGGLLLDGGAGAGRVFDWSLAKPVRARARFVMLAGGLTPENLGAAVAMLRPDGLDVSSGVETAPGVKDAARIRAFVAAARRAEVAA
jgi:phosphoribosylanthranilate isomerase